VSNSSFKDLNIIPEVQKVIDELGFVTPTEIQEKAIPELNTTDRDFVGQAQTGTGKTLAFVAPLLSKIDYKINYVQAIVLAPTRELAMQVEAEIVKLGKYTGIKSTCIYGGTVYDNQIEALNKDRPQIVVGTPGRVIDMINKGHLRLDKAKFCILDEADEMLTMGFFEDVQIVLSKFNNKRQLMMFSATMPKPIIRLIKNEFNNPLIVKIEKKTLSNDDIEQKYFVVRDKHFKEALARLIDDARDVYGIVFCRTKIETKEVGDDLKKRGMSVDILNGDMGQTERDHSMRNFKNKKVNILVCTDVAARGIDIDNLTHVFNYGLPRDNESYVHRIGRTGRAGMKGKAYTIVGPKSDYAIKNIERHIKDEIEFSKLPSVDDLKRNLVEREVAAAGQILEAIKAKGEDFKTEVAFDLLVENFGDLSHEELLKLMFVWKFNKEMRHYNNLSDIEKITTSTTPGTARKDRTKPGRHESGSNNRSDSTSKRRHPGQRKFKK
jgi:ATP-dependent RNA helicase DeaD